MVAKNPRQRGAGEMRLPFDNAVMRDKYGAGPYATAPRGVSPLARALPTLYFYWRLATGPVQWLFRKGAKNQCDDVSWSNASCWCADELENAGCRIEIEGLEHVRGLDSPRVYVANHMSVLETFILPGILRPLGPVTFVVKKSLVSLPLFGPVMRSRDPVVLGRKNPREDLATMFSEGEKRLRRGVSVVVFPQGSREAVFNPAHFNSIGAKLAARAGVPAVPVALKTDAWGLGKHVKELGKISPSLPIRFVFGKPVEAARSPREAQAEILGFINALVSKWQKEDGEKR